MFEHCFRFVAKCNILVFLGVLTIGIQNNYIQQVRYEPQLSDNVRCSEVSRFSITKLRRADTCIHIPYVSSKLGLSLLKSFGGDKPYCLRFDDVTIFTQP